MLQSGSYSHTVVSHVISNGYDIEIHLHHCLPQDSEKSLELCHERVCFYLIINRELQLPSIKVKCPLQPERDNNNEHVYNYT